MISSDGQEGGGDGVGVTLVIAAASRVVLAYYVREQRVLSLADAVHRMTGLPANYLKLQDRGVLREGRGRTSRSSILRKFKTIRPGMIPPPTPPASSMSSSTANRCWITVVPTGGSRAATYRFEQRQRARTRTHRFDLTAIRRPEMPEESLERSARIVLRRARHSFEPPSAPRLTAELKP